MSGSIINEVGNSHGELVVLKRDKNDKWGNTRWVCLCSCGKKNIVRGSKLRSGNTKSCGCFFRIIPHKIHGMSGTKTYKSWDAMKQRCSNKNKSGYHRYGGRGIKVCDRWMKFENFYKDMEDKPNGLTLDRIDNDGNYEPGNCRWATWKQQASNKLKSGGNPRLISINGKTQNITAWSKEFNISRNLVYSRLFSGWTVKRALSTPVNKNKSRF